MFVTGALCAALMSAGLVTIPAASAAYAEGPAQAIAPSQAYGTPAAEDPESSEAVTVVRHTADGGLEVAKVPADDPLAAAAALDAEPGVAAASPVIGRALLAEPDAGPDDGQRYAPAQPGSGSSRDLQWALNRLQAEDAWKASTGEGITVAVLDTGVDSGHPDLAGSLVPGFDAIRSQPTINGSDAHGHGTHVAGLIAGHGKVTGIAPAAKIMPIKVMDRNGFGTTYNIVSGIIWAVNHGADVLNMSIGSPTPDPAERSAVKWARGRGVLVIAAAGNDGTSAPVYPAAYGASASDANATDPVIGVGAVDSAGLRGWFSQENLSVDVAAPGVKLLSTFPAGKGGYAWESGTSMASPYVAGVAALGLSYARRAHPSWSGEYTSGVVESALRRSTHDLGVPGRDRAYGSGEVSAASILEALNAPVHAAMSIDASLIGKPGGSALASFSTTEDTSISARLTSAPGYTGAPAATSPADGAEVYTGPGGESIQQLITGLSPNASYALTIFATDAAGVSRTVTGLRPLKWSVTKPKTSGAGKRVQVSAVLPGVGQVPAGKITVAYKWAGKGRKKAHASPVGSELSSVAMPKVRAKLKFQVSVPGGKGFWPGKSKVYKVAR